MTEIFVEKNIMNQYKAVTKEEAETKLSNGYVGAQFQVGDVSITLYWINFNFLMISKEKIQHEVMEYFNYINSITGIPIPDLEI